MFLIYTIFQYLFRDKIVIIDCVKYLIGIFSLVLLFVVFVGNSTFNSSNVRRKRYFSLFILLLFQSQITSPTFWVILLLSKIDRKFI